MHKHQTGFFVYSELTCNEQVHVLCMCIPGVKLQTVPTTCLKMSGTLLDVGLIGVGLHLRSSHARLLRYFPPAHGPHVT